MNILSRRYLFLPCAVIVAAILASAVFAEPLKTVTLTIDYGDGAQKQWTALPWREGGTIAEAMDQAAKHRRGLTYVKQGSGDSSFLTQIDDCKNGDGNRYWMYQVNAKKGTRSYAAVKLEPNDHVVWKFEAYDE